MQLPPVTPAMTPVAATAMSSTENGRVPAVTGTLPNTITTALVTEA